MNGLTKCAGQHSPPEHVLRSALSVAGLHLEPQIQLVLHNGQNVDPDLGDPVTRFYISLAVVGD